MKKILLFTLIIVLSAGFSSCSSEDNEEFPINKEFYTQGTAQIKLYYGYIVSMHVNDTLFIFKENKTDDDYLLFDKLDCDSVIYDNMYNKGMRPTPSNPTENHRFKDVSLSNNKDKINLFYTKK